MSRAHQKDDFVARRGELLAELFLQDLRPEFVARPEGDFGYDFFVGFRNPRGGINNVAVEIKATERVARDRHPIPRREYDRLANSNIPVLFLLIDVKNNQLYYSWLSQEAAGGSRESSTVMVGLTRVDDLAKKELRERLAS